MSWGRVGAHAPKIEGSTLTPTYLSARAIERNAGKDQPDPEELLGVLIRVGQ